MKRIEEYSIDDGDAIALGICTDYGTYIIYRKEEYEGVSVLSAQVTTGKEQEKKNAAPILDAVSNLFALYDYPDRYGYTNRSDYNDYGKVTNSAKNRAWDIAKKSVTKYLQTLQ